MKKDKSKSKFFGKMRKKVSGAHVDTAAGEEELSGEDLQHMLEQFEAVKKNPGHLTGWDFDRAFDFIERYSSTSQAEILFGQMYATIGQQLKGLSYASAVKVVRRMPGHAGSDSIIKGMYKLESDYIQELHSNVIAGMLTIIPDHPLAAELTTALATKNLTNAYDFITVNPENIYTKTLIKAMFDRDSNIAILLLQEKMDHPHVGSIFEGIYAITDNANIRKLTPNAIIFILDVAPDHPKVQTMIDVLVEQNYVKAYDFVKSHSDHALVADLKRQILVRKPELKKLFEEDL